MKAYWCYKDLKMKRVVVHDQKCSHVPVRDDGTPIDPDNSPKGRRFKRQWSGPLYTLDKALLHAATLLQAVPAEWKVKLCEKCGPLKPGREWDRLRELNLIPKDPYKPFLISPSRST